MLSEEDVISLIVKSDNASAMKLRIVRIKSRKHSSDAMTDASVEVIEDQLRHVISQLTAILLH